MKIFVSATSQQLGDCRRQVASDLRAAMADVDVQEDFRQGRGTLIEKLQDVVDADLVVLIIGSALGQLAIDDAVPTTDPPRSWTQWEWFFAMGERLPPSPRAARKDVLVYIASDAFCQSHSVDQTPEAAENQRRFVEAVKRSGTHYAEFSTVDELRASVLRDVAIFSNRPRRPQNLPYRPLGSLFTGRAAFLEKMRASFARPRAQGGPQATAITATQAVHGLGGIGKTRTAVEYAWAHEQQYCALLFVPADSPQVLERSLAALCGPLVLDLPLPEDAKQADQVAAVVRWLQDHPGWFLLIDNVDTPEAQRAVNGLLGHVGNGGHVLITSRRGAWTDGVEALELGVLAHADAVSYLLNATDARRAKTATDAADAGTLAKHLDGLALALEQAAAMINHRSLTLGDYLARWLEGDARVKDWPKDALHNYPHSVATTWLVTFEQLSEAAMMMLRVLAQFAPDPIPREMGAGEAAGFVIASLLKPDAKPGELVSADAEEALAELAAYSLVTWEDTKQTFRLHRLVGKVTRDRIGENVAANAVVSAIAILDEFVPGDPPPGDVRSWPLWRVAAAHATAVIERAERLSVGTAASRLMNELGMFHFARGAWSEAEPLMRRAISMREISFGAENPEITAVLNNLAWLLYSTNRMTEAEPLIRRALAIDEASYGTDHPKVATDLNNLAQALKATNRLAEAEPLMRRVISIFEKSLGPQHPSVATALNNLAQTLQTTNRLAEAEPLMRRALAIDEASYGKDHPDVARDLNNLASLLYATNRLSETEPLMRRALAIDEASYGSDHPSVAVSLNNLAQLLMATKRLSEAEPLMRRVISILEKSFGSEHPQVATALNNLATLLYSTNRVSEAEPLMRRALASDEASYGSDHSKLATDLNNLAALLKDTNRLSEAEPLSRRQLEILLKFTVATGHQHPQLHASVGNYAEILKAIGLSKSEVDSRLSEVLATYGISLGSGDATPPASEPTRQRPKNFWARIRGWIQRVLGRH